MTDKELQFKKIYLNHLKENDYEYVVYKTTVKSTGHFYIGCHKHKRNDNYYGSGIAILKYIELFGTTDLSKEILSYHGYDRTEAYEEESRQIKKYFKDPLCLNKGYIGWL